MHPSNPNPTEIAYAAIRRVVQPIRPEWPQGARFFVSPPVLTLFMVMMTVLGFLVMAARARSHFSGGF